MSLLKFDDVVKKQDLETRDVLIPEWGGSVRIRQWTVAERNDFTKRKDEPGIGAWLVSILTVDEEGKQWCPAERAMELDRKNPKALDAIVAAIIEVNTVNKEEV